MSKSNLELFSSRNDYYKFEILSNWQKAIHINKKPELLKKFNLLELKDKFVFFYGGNIGLAQGIDTLIALAKSLVHKKHIHFIFIGQGDAVHLLHDSNLNNITYLPSIKQNQYYELSSNFDVGLVSLHPNHTANNFPGKIWGYMSLKKPIVGVVNIGNDVKCLINDNNAGLLVEHNEDISRLTKYCINLSKNPKFCARQGLNSRKILKNFTPEKAFIQILSFFKSRKQLI